MSKIEKVKLENIRAFRNTFNEVDFNNQKGLPADFICIYGQNGMGKTSFFDGIEWYTSGGIYRFEDNNKKKEIKRYKGYIISNRNVKGDKEKSYVEVKYSDGFKAKRTVSRFNKEVKEKGYRDYNKGRLTPKFEMNISDKQILPHNKIDSFIYADSPSKKYEEWGKFWDSDGSQRDLFNKVYKIKKLLSKRVELLSNELHEYKGELKELIISDEKIEEINIKIDEFNQEESIFEESLKRIIRSNNEIINIPDKLKINNYKKDINKIIDEEKLKKEKVNYLLSFYQKNYSEKELDLNNKGKKLKESIDNYKILKLSGKAWFEEYNQWLKLSSELKLFNKKLQFKEASLEAKNKSLQSFEEKINSYNKLLKYLVDKELYLISKAKEIEEVMKIISNNTTKRKENYIKLEKLNILKQDNIRKVNSFEDAKVKNEKKDFYIHVTSIVENDKDFSNLKTKYVEKFNIIDYKIKNISAAVNKEKEIYDACKKNCDELENILIKVKTYIEKEGLSNCPVCHTPYKNVELLLDEINLDEQNDNCKKIYNNYQLKLDEKQSLINYRKELINKWNEECEKNTGIIAKRNSEIVKEMSMIEKENNDLEELIIVDTQKIKDFNIELNKIEFYKEDIEQDAIKEWLRRIKSSYNDNLNKLTNEKNQVLELQISLKKQREDLKFQMSELEENNNNFNDKINNTILINKLDELNIKNKISVQKWYEFENYYNSLILEYKEIEKEMFDCKSYINEYNVSELRKSFKEEKQNYSKIKYNDYMLQIFKKDDIKFAELIDLSVNIDCIIMGFIKKISIIDYIINELCNSDYNVRYMQIYRAIEAKKIELKKFKYSKEKIYDIFVNLKKYIEENIQDVLGSKSMNQIYSIIEPNKEFKKLKTEVVFKSSNSKEDDIPELHLKSDSETNETILPEYFFSTAQLNTVALSIFLGQALSLDLEVKTIFIDDPVGHFDDINVLAFVDLLRNIVKDGKWQIVISTHDESFYNILKNKISDEYYNSKFITFTSIGNLKEDK